MIKLQLSVIAALLALLAAPVHAQKDAPGEARAVTSKPATANEKKDARAKRLATSKEMVKNDEGRLEDLPGAAPGKTVTAEEKAAARTSRKAAGKQAAKAGSGRLDDVDTKR